MKSFSCPNCDSELCSAIRFWREGKQTEFVDAFKCHDCGQLTEPGTKKKLSYDYQPRRDVKPGQVNIFGVIENMRSTIDRVPKMVESPAGLSVGVYVVPADAPIGYRTEVKRMMLEMNTKHSGRHMPHWYKYRKIKRGKK